MHVSEPHVFAYIHFMNHMHASSSVRKEREMDILELQLLTFFIHLVSAEFESGSSEQISSVVDN